MRLTEGIRRGADSEAEASKFVFITPLARILTRFHRGQSNHLKFISTRWVTHRIRKFLTVSNRLHRQ